MLKFHRICLAFTSTIVLLPALPAWSLPASPDALCFMQTATGQLINLDRLCTPTTEPQISPSANPRIAVSRVNFDGQKLQGLLTNQTGQTVRKVAINYTIVDRRGKELDAGMITQRTPIAPGASIAFERASSHPGATVRINAIDWTL
jgi:hypothetical protein